MKPILRSAVPGNEPETEVAGLKPWVRRVATAYLVVLIPVMVLIVVMMILHAPRVFATAYDSLGVRWDKVTHAFNSGQVGTGIGDGFQCLALVLPALGMVVSSGRIGKRLGTGTWRWSAGSPLRRAIVLTGTAAAVGLAAYTWWPNGDYRPIQPGERGTLTGGLKELSAITTGRPSLTPQRQQQLHGAPFEQPIQARTSSNSEPHQSSTNRIQVPTTTETTPTTTATTPADTSTATTPTTTDTSTTTTPTTTDTSTTTTPTTTTTDTSTTTTPTTTDTTTTTTP